MVNALLEAQSIDAGYQGVVAVRNLNLAVSQGEVVVLLGPNGAGKTTTLMTLAGALAPISGSIFMDGERTTKPLHQRAQKGLALLTEHRAVAMALTTLDNLKLGRGNPELALEFFPELEARLHTRAGLLSGGEQQMLALARILSGSPRVLLADELSLGLAPLITERLLRAIREAADRGLGVILVEQQAHQALEMADRCIVLVRGNVRMDCAAEVLTNDFDQLSALYFD